MNSCNNYIDSHQISNFLTVNLKEEVIDSSKINEANEQETISNKVFTYFEYIKNLVHFKNKKEFKDFFYDLNSKDKHDEASSMINQLLKDASKGFISTNKAPYLFIIKNIKKIYPQINPFFTDPKIQSDTKIISPKGIEVIIGELKEKRSLNDMKSFVCCNYKELEIQMLQAIEEMENQNLLNRCCFHVRCFGEYKKSRHVAPIYLEKQQKGKYISFLTDSVGKNGISYIISSVTKDIFNKANIKATRYIYTGKARQKDQTNCTIFSISDGLYFAKHSEELKEWTTKHGQKDGDEEDVIHLNNLPLKMMKTTQFLSFMQKLEEEANDSIGLNIKHLQMSSKGKIYNSKTISNYLKYERLIIAKAIKNK